MNPGVPPASTSRSILGASGFPLRVHLEDLAPPIAVGTIDDDLAVEAARPKQRRIENIRPVRRRDQDDVVFHLEAVHLDQELVQRLLPLVVPTAEPRTTMPPDRVDLVDEDDARRRLLRLLEQIPHPRAPTPTNISTKSEPEIEKNGTPASPATARASSVLPVPGGPYSNTPFGIRAPNA